jgi:hypothetical protein
MSYRIQQSDNTSRKVIDLAVGVLVGLRGCRPEEAFAELVDVVHRTGVGLGAVATQLVALASGADSDFPAHDSSAWADLIGQRRGLSVAAAQS